MKSNSYFFDITTSARWSGHPVGIVRVERELASRARKHLGDQVAHCVYDQSIGAFRIVKDEFVGELLSGAARIDFDPSAPGLGSPSTKGLRRQLRNMALEVPAAYQFIQRLRGHSFSAHEVRKMRLQLKQAPTPQQMSSTNHLALSTATSSAIELDPSVTIISGGLDWEHKHIRTIYNLRQKTKFKFISIIYDLIPINLPHYVVPHYVNLLTEYFGELLWTTDGCLCISDTTKRDLIAYFLDNGLSPCKAYSFPLGTDLHKSSPASDSFPAKLKDKNYILYVSTIEPRKNHRVAYDAWCHGLLCGTINAHTDRLVFVGRQGWLTGDLAHEISTNPLTRDSVISMSSVSDGELAALYRGALFTIFPSFYEGFGLPLAEALGYGKVCVTSGAGALSEIGNGFRIDIDPRDTISWANKFAELLNDKDGVAAMEAEIRRSYDPVDWDVSATVFFESLEKIVLLNV